MLTKQEQTIFELTKSITTKTDWLKVFEDKNIKEIVLALYEKDLYKSKTKSVLTKFINNVKSYDFPPTSNKYPLLNFGTIENLKKVPPLELNNFLEKRLYSANQKSDAFFFDIFKNFNDLIYMDIKIKYLKKNHAFIKFINFDNVSDELFAKALFKEMNEIYPDLYIFNVLLKERTQKALEQLTDSQLTTLNKTGIDNYLGIKETHFEKFVYSDSSYKINFMSKRYFEQKFKVRPFLFMNNNNYKDLLKSMIKGKINTNQKVLLVSQVINFNDLSEKELVSLKENGFVPFPIRKKNIEVYGRSNYIIDLLKSALKTSKSTEGASYIFKHLANYMQYIMTTEEFLNTINVKNYSLPALLQIAGAYPEDIFENNGTLKLANAVDSYELSESF